MAETPLVLHNAHILTMDERYTQYENGALVVQGDSILALGPEEELLAAYPNAERFDCAGRVLMPGFVNAHTHVPMTLLRGLADDLRLDVWLLGYMMPVEREFVTPEFVQLGTKIACAEFIRTGVTCFADMYYFEEDVARATAEAGLRALCAQTVLKFPTPDAASYEDALAYARDFIARWKDHPLIVPSVAPHAPYTCTEEILRESARLAAEFDVPLHTHLAETQREVEDMRREHDMPVIPYVKKQGLFAAKVLAAHCVHIDRGEMRTLLHAGAGVAHNPSSNLKLASGIAPVPEMLEVGLNVGIGTDGPASNNDLDMVEEIRLTALLAKGGSGDPTVVPARQALAMATRIGAAAMHLGDITGSLEVGKRADLILLDLTPLHNSPRFRRDENNIYAQIVYAAKSTDVTDVMVNGRWLMRDRHLLTLDEEALLAEAQEIAEQINAFLHAREESVLSKLIALGGSSEQESFEVQIKVQLPDRDVVRQRLASLAAAGQLEIVRTRHYGEHDVYFEFDDPEQGRLRYREDDFLDDQGQVTGVRARLTLIGIRSEDRFEDAVVLSRSRYLAPATNPLRFYREYFKPAKEKEIVKDRLRWLVRFEDQEFFINLDRFQQPALGDFLEVKSRTWSRRDAEHKAQQGLKLLQMLAPEASAPITSDYIDL